jgi:hypothetical protein
LLAYQALAASRFFFSETMFRISAQRIWLKMPQ